ncbi:hypothetical protein [Sphingomonas montana]|uniref:hypothetical protein n=1 Tax=Sphingomonas montana TaxID=1843236 RepID=UPI00101AD387|nr:hypothetical protein [Sphingomonas montana]
MKLAGLTKGSELCLFLDGLQGDEKNDCWLERIGNRKAHAFTYPVSIVERERSRGSSPEYPQMGDSRCSHAKRPDVAHVLLFATRDMLAS